MADEIIHQFFTYGTQYYLVGRFAAFAGQSPIVGNLMHHAVEMFIKGALAKSMSLAQMKDQLRHKLPEAWARFKAIGGGNSLDRFDATIATLNSFENIRYPDEIIKSGAVLYIGIHKAVPVTPEFEGGYSPPKYNLTLEEIDELVAEIFKTASRNPKAYLEFPKSEARHFAFLENKHFSPK